MAKTKKKASKKNGGKKKLSKQEQADKVAYAVRDALQGVGASKIEAAMVAAREAVLGL